MYIHIAVIPVPVKKTHLRRGRHIEIMICCIDHMLLCEATLGIMSDRIISGSHSVQHVDSINNIMILQNTRSGAGEQLLLLDCRAMGCAEGMCVFTGYRLPVSCHIVACLHVSICACHPCAGAMLTFSVPCQC